jgi:membrane-associated phospholipid phosphatase
MPRVPSPLIGLLVWCTPRLMGRLLAGAVGLALLVAALAWVVVLSPLALTAGLDRPILETVADTRSPGPTAVSHAVVHLASPEFAGIGTVVLIGVVGLRRQRWDVVVTIGATVWGAFAVSVLLKFLTLRDRPGDDLALVDAVGPAFPSGHVIRAVALYGVLAWLSAPGLRGWRRSLPWIAAFVIVMVVGAGRVYLGAHWVSDVVAAGVIAAVWTWYAVRMLRLERERFASPGASAGSVRSTAVGSRPPSPRAVARRA